MDILKYYFYYLDSQFTGFPLIIRITVFIVMLLILLYAVSMIRFFYIKRKRKKKEKLYKKMAKRFEENLKRVLFDRQNLSRNIIISKLEFEQGSLKNKEKEPVTKLLLFVKSCEDQTLNEHNYFEVIDIFELIEYWEELLRKNNLKKNRQALRNLEELAKSGYGNITAHKILGRNHDLRKHSKSSYMRFASHDAFRFLEDDFDKEFNSLDEMRIRAALEERAKQKNLPLLIRWVHTAQNESYKCFLIKEIGFFNQKESGSQLVKMYQKEKSYPVRAQIAETLGILKYNDAIDILIDSYGINPAMVQIRIIDALGNMDSPKSLSFLEKIYGETQDVDLLTEIVDNIYKLDQDKGVFYKLKQKSTDGFQESVFTYVEKMNEIAFVN